MNRRSELRFQVYTVAKVAHFDEPEHELDAQMVDVSPSGVRLVAEREFHEDDIARAHEDAGDEVEPLLRTGGDQQRVHLRRNPARLE